jgi:hypothetical protein
MRYLATNEMVKIIIKECVNACFKDFNGIRFRDSGAC